MAENFSSKCVPVAKEDDRIISRKACTSASTLRDKRACKQLSVKCSSDKLYLSDQSSHEALGSKSTNISGKPYVLVFELRSFCHVEQKFFVSQRLTIWH